MGYYSDVSIAIKKADMECLKSQLAKKAFTPDVPINILNFVLNAIKDGQQDNDNNISVLSWYSLKWYKEFPEIQFINKFLNTLDEYEFIRIGEDEEDIEHYGGFEDGNVFEVTRQISRIY